MSHIVTIDAAALAALGLEVLSTEDYALEQVKAAAQAARDKVVGGVIGTNVTEVLRGYADAVDAARRAGCTEEAIDAVATAILG